MRYPLVVLLFTMVALCSNLALAGEAEATVRVATFNVDVSPPIGSPVAYVPARSIVDPLTARGIIIIASGKPVVLCAVDFIGIGNEGQDRWRRALASAVGTGYDRVAVHSLHQHDGCRCDFTIEHILSEYGLGGTRFDNDFLSEVIARTAKAAGEAVARAQPVTHVGIGQAMVEKVASNRRILGDDGKVKIVRFSRSSNPEAIAAPEGTIDPWLKSLSFWNEEHPVAVLTYYATHPQSHYGEGDVTCEFVGLARNRRESETSVPHIHFTGASGNIAAGKYNDGSPENRPVLTARMEAGMKAALEATTKEAILPSDVEWRSRYTMLPIARNLDEEILARELADDTLDKQLRYSAAAKLAWLRRSQAALGVDISALRIGKAWLLQLPGEAFVEYQLAAQAMKPGEFVCTAAYGDIGPGYIGTEIAYFQGGYETGVNASFVSPDVEKVLTNAIAAVLSTQQ